MTNALLVYCTCSDHAEATRLAQELVEQRAAACANIVPSVQSVYRWQGKIETSTEHLLLIKTTSDRFAALRDLIVQLHSYDTPEIIATVIEAGYEPYLKWLKES